MKLFQNTLYVGQVIFPAEHFRGEARESLSVPRGESAAFDRELEKNGTA